LEWKDNSFIPINTYSMDDFENNKEPVVLDMDANDPAADWDAMCANFDSTKPTTLVISSNNGTFVHPKWKLDCMSLSVFLACAFLTPPCIFVSQVAFLPRMHP